MANLRIPGAPDVPSIEVGMPTVTPSTTNELRIKGVGETGTIASPPAVLNAVVDALTPLGVTEIVGRRALRTIWRAIRSAKARRAKPGAKNGRGGCGMIPAPFEYVRAGSVDEAVAALSSHEDAAAGRRPLLAARDATAPRSAGHVVDIRHLRPVVHA